MKYRGIVQKGAERGRTLGFPTANIRIEDSVEPGIYAARVKIGDVLHDAAAYIGGPRDILEAHLLNFFGDLYGKEIEVELCKKIRGDKKFVDVETLRAQIKSDVTDAKAYFKNI